MPLHHGLDDVSVAPEEVATRQKGVLAHERAALSQKTQETPPLVGPPASALRSAATMSQTLVFIGLLTICIPKYVPVPIFIPLYLIALGAAIYVAQKGMQRNAVIALVAFQFAPLALMRERSLADVQSWGMKGTYGAGAPMKGVYLFDGLPLSIVDWSHCIWYEQGKTAYCHLPNVIGLWPSGVNAAAAGFIPTADLGSGGPTQEELSVTPPWPLFAMFYHVALHSRLDFYFNDALTEAQVYENVCLAATASPSPLGTPRCGSNPKRAGLEMRNN